MNTVFKLGYQAWLLLGARRRLRAAVGGRAGCRAARGRRGRPVGGGRCCCSALVYPYAGTYARKRRLRAQPDARRARLAARRARPATSRRSTGCATTRPATPVVLEAVGDGLLGASATRASRPSPGCPTVLGWPGHELQWEPRPGRPRRATSRALYTTTDAAEARELLDRYGVRYVVVGPLERDRPTATPASPSGTSSASASSTATARRSGDLRSAPLAHVEPLRHAARRVPRLALGEPAPPARAGDIAP